MNKNESHTAFFGGALLGVNPIRWVEARDGKEWLEEVMLIEDVISCQYDIYNLKDIDKSFNVSSNIFNLSIVWGLNTMYRMKRTPIVEEAMNSILVIGMMKHLCAFMYKRFKYPADEKIALMLFEILDMKSDLKKEGSWIKLLRSRTHIFLNTKGRYPDVWMDMIDDTRTVRMCNEINGNIRVTVNRMTERYYEVKGSQDRIMSSSKLGTIEGEKVIKDYIRKPQRLKDDMARISRDPRNLIRKELLNFTTDILTTAKPEFLEKSLNHLSDNYVANKGYAKMIDDLIIYILTMNRRTKISFNNIPMFISKLSSVFRSSGTNQREVLELKKDLLKLSTESLGGQRRVLLAANSTALLIYLSMRILSIEYFK